MTKKIAVIGAGIVGVASAYELAADGHDVTVLDRRSGVAAETSFANAGLVAPGWMATWTRPALPARALAGVARQPRDTLRWLWQRWRAARPEAQQQALRRLAQYSHERLQTLRHGLQLDYERQDGLLMLLRSARELRQAQTSLRMMGELGIRHRLLDAAQCRAIEPGLNEQMALHGGIQLDQDEVGNCRQFAHLLRGEAQRLGAEFRFNTVVHSIEPGDRPRVQHAALDAADVGPVSEQFDAVLLCAGNGSAALLHGLGLRLPLLPVWGHSITAPLRRLEAHPDLGPRSCVLDTRHRVTISRIGQRVRVAGGAELGGRADRPDAATLARLHKVLHDWFPGAALSAQAQSWCGAQPTLPDGPPVLGASGLPGLWLNLGHGAGGWTLACGSARVLADQLAGQAPAIGIEGLDISRLR